MDGLNRRQFVAAAAACACACAAGEELFAQQKNDSVLVDVGAPEDFAKDGLYDKHLRPSKILLVREGTRLYAIHGVCTHKACTVKIKEEKIVCPCHGSTFDNSGTPIKEPAKAALFRYGIKLDGGRLIVDRSKRFGEKEWDKPESYFEPAAQTV